MQVHGAWPEAMDEAKRACERLSQPPHPAIGAAFYQRGEIHRLRGEFTKAEEATAKPASRDESRSPACRNSGLRKDRLTQP